MDIIDENKYYEIKSILSGCRNITDAKYLIKLYLKNNSESKKLAYSLLYGKIYDDSNNFNTFFELMNNINDSDNYEYCTKIINDFYPNKNCNSLQIKTLTKILNKKNIIKNNETNTYQTDGLNNFLNLTNNKNNKKTKHNDIVKNCPHCSKQYIGYDGLTHVICGYHNQHYGYDWKGCMKDWCFTCGKKLCKSWNENKLYLEINRIHDSECCKKYASNNCELYENYCQCNNKYVKR